MAPFNLLPVLETSIAFQKDLPSINDDETKTSLETAAVSLQAGRTVAFPTETVYGLGADATNSSAVQQIFRIKGRPLDNPLIAHVDSLNMLQRYIPGPLTDVYSALTSTFWPGPLTLLFPLPPDAGFAPEVTAAQPTIAIRMPAHPVARALIHLANRPLAAPSANTSGRPSPTQHGHVQADMAIRAANDPAFPSLTILQGSVSDVGLESTVVDGITHPGELRVLRPGGIGPDALEACLAKAGLHALIKVYGRDWKNAKEEAAPSTPGMKYKHYSPACKTVCVQAERPVSQDELLSFVRHALGADAGKTIGILRRSPSHLPLLPAPSVDFDFGATSQEQATNLFAGLRTLEQASCDLILVECPPADQWTNGIGLAVQERLSKATAQTSAAWHRFD